MTLPFGPGLFVRIEREVAAWDPPPALGPAGGTDDGAPVSLRDARVMLYDRSVDPGVRDGLWRRTAALARTGGTPRHRLAAVWLALPGLRRTMYKIAYRLGQDREDVASELITAYLEALERVGPQTPDVASALLRPACTAAWSAAGAARLEVPTEDMGVFTGAAAATGEVGEEWPDHRWEVDFAGPNRPEGLTADLRFTLPPGRVEGVRIGALAQAYGLTDTVRQTTRRPRGRRIGTLSLPGPRRRR
ncbi:hypothetical protein [Streptomyces lichenis]|uniref:Uncharacterized protein n=1 Tax=Streptomyces lichenis TaxID=2306967 RepID=A0ABT0I760_9ACTN|nr:hypothetical protein [Streptomyces lichenis]MCK8677140.1 hypothetical protein [Streptomyces lichenis]